MAIKRKNKKRKAITILLILIFIICNFSFTVINSEGVTVNEIIGSDKYDTSIKVSRELCKISKINTIVLVNENSVAEGLIATPLANIENASILLTEKDKLINVTKDELKRVAPKKIIIIGGENSISDNVVSQIKGELPSVTIERLGGENRYETSLKIAQAIDAKQDIKNIYVGCSEVDLLSIASKAGEEKQPIILSKEDGLDKEAYKWLKEEELENAYIIGRKDTLNNSLIDNLKRITKSNLKNNIITGNDIYEININVIKEFYKNERLKTVLVITPNSLANTVTLNILVSKLDAPIILVNEDKLLHKQKSLLDKKRSEVIYTVYGDIKDNILKEIILSLSKIKLKTINFLSSKKNRLEKLLNNTKINWLNESETWVLPGEEIDETIINKGNKINLNKIQWKLENTDINGIGNRIKFTAPNIEGTYKLIAEVEYDNKINRIEKEILVNSVNNGFEDLNNEDNELINKNDINIDYLSIDTDNDGLSDKSEIKIYKTDPLNSDTDNDGILDGYEINLNLNPKKFNDKNELYNLNINNKEICTSIDIYGNDKSVATTRLTKVKDEYYESIDGKVGNIINLKSEEKLDKVIIDFSYNKDEINKKNIKEEYLKIYIIDEVNLKLIELDTIVDKENNKIKAQFDFNGKVYIDDNNSYKYLIGDSSKIQKDLSKIDVVFALDYSASMGPHENNGPKPGNDINFFRCDVTKTLIEKLDGDYRFGLVKFDGDTTILNNLTDNKIDLYEILDNIKSIALGNNGTNITKAIEISSELFNKSDDRRKFIILLADGADNKSSESEIIKASQDIYEKYNAQIYTVGLGKDINSNILEKIAESTNGKYFSADKAENLLKEFMNISSNIQKEDVKLIASNEFNINDQLPYGNFRHPKYGGQCYGMALTSILNYQNRLPKQVALDKNHYEKEYNLPTKDYIITSNPKDKNIRDCINWWWNSQTMKISNLNKINNIDDIKNKIDKEPLLISFKGNGIGHAVVGQKLYQNSRYENEYYIEVYDSNYPKENRYIKVVEEYTLDGKVNLNLDALDYKFDNGLNLFYTTDVDKVYKYLEKNYYF